MPSIATLAVDAILGLAAKFFRIMREKEQVTLEVFQQVIDSRERRQNLGAFMRAGCPKFTELSLKPSSWTSWERAREIMGQNFFGLEETTKYFRINPAAEDIAALNKIPFSEETLVSVKDTHILVAVFPLTIPQIRISSRTRGVRLCYERVHAVFAQDDGGLPEQLSIQEHGEAEWWLIQKFPLEDSFSKGWEEQLALLSPTEQMVPTAQGAAYAMVGHFLATGEELFKGPVARTSSRIGNRHLTLTFGSMDTVRLGDSGSHAYGNVHLMVARRPNT